MKQLPANILMSKLLAELWFVTRFLPQNSCGRGIASFETLNGNPTDFILYTQRVGRRRTPTCNSEQHTIGVLTEHGYIIKTTNNPKVPAMAQCVQIRVTNSVCMFSGDKTASSNDREQNNGRVYVAIFIRIAYSSSHTTVTLYFCL